MIIGSATLNGLPDRAKRPKHSTNKAFDKLGVYSKSPKVADAMIEAVKISPPVSIKDDLDQGGPHPVYASELPRGVGSKHGWKQKTTSG